MAALVAAMGAASAQNYTGPKVEITYLHGFTGPDRPVMEELVKKFNDQLGDTITLLNHKWRVCGVVEPGKLARLFARLHRLQQLTGSEGKLSQLFLKLDDPARTQEVVR
ncbi:MAG: hypothetical protein K6T35_14465, partial [Meiothermus silvanus]|nr:hypothetical protein [Allomeiothermus silvanus]